MATPPIASPPLACLPMVSLPIVSLPLAALPRASPPLVTGASRVLASTDHPCRTARSTSRAAAVGETASAQVDSLSSNTPANRPRSRTAPVARSTGGAGGWVDRRVWPSVAAARTTVSATRRARRAEGTVCQARVASSSAAAQTNRRGGRASTQRMARPGPTPAAVPLAASPAVSLSARHCSATAWWTFASNRSPVRPTGSWTTRHRPGWSMRVVGRSSRIVSRAPPAPALTTSSGSSTTSA
jgi:hypothetical protein